MQYQQVIITKGFFFGFPFASLYYPGHATGKSHQLMRAHSQGTPF
jgi:hypothetical protein